MTANESETSRLLEVEYLRLQASIDKFDEQRFKIKGWSITVAGALAALAINTKQVSLFFVAAPVVLFFAFMELIYTNVQRSVIYRSNEVERLIDIARREGVGAAHDSYTFGMGKMFKENKFRWREVPGLLRRRPHLTLFYLGMMLALLGAGLLWIT